MNLESAKVLQSILWDKISEIIKEKQRIESSYNYRHKGILELINRFENNHPGIEEQLEMKGMFEYYFPGLEEFTVGETSWRKVQRAINSEEQKTPKDTEKIAKLTYIRILIDLENIQEEKEQGEQKISILDKEEENLKAQIRRIYAMYPEEFFGPGGAPPGFFGDDDNDTINESVRSNRHVSHLGGLGSGDGLSTSLNQDMNPPKISGGGFEGTADANFSKKIGQLRVHIDDKESLMFPDNENIEMSRDKDVIRGKVPFQGKYKLRENKSMDLKTIEDFINLEIVPMLNEATNSEYVGNPELSGTKWRSTSYVNFSMPTVRVHEPVFGRPGMMPFVQFNLKDIGESDFDVKINIYDHKDLLRVKKSISKILNAYKNRNSLKESKEKKKKLIDLFSDSFFKPEEDYSEFKELETEIKDEEFKKLVDGTKYTSSIDLNNKTHSKNYSHTNVYDSEGKPKKSIDKINEFVKTEVFSMLKEALEKKGLTLVKKEEACSECGMMNEHCGCEKNEIEEMNVTANIAGYQTKLSTPSSMKKHKENMLPKGYKYF